MAVPKYAKITQFVLDYISDNGLQPGDKLFTEKQLCEKFGVSRITVQTALSDLQTDGVIYRVRKGGTFVGEASPVKESIQPQADSQNIIPFVINRDTIASRTFDIIAGAQEFLQSKSKYLTIHSANGNNETEREIINSLIEQNFKAIMVKPFHGNANIQFYFDLLKQGVNLVFVDMLPNGLSGNVVRSDNFMGGYLATGHLIQNGYRNIAVLHADEDKGPNAPERIRGYKAAHHEHSLTIREEYICALKSLDDNILRNEIPKALDKLLAIKKRPDAIFCTNDMIAFDVFHALKKRNIVVPDDIALIGFDNVALSSKNSVAISTVEQDFHSIGYQAAKLCCETEEKISPGYTQLLLPVTLIPRDSSKAKRENEPTEQIPESRQA